MIYLTNITKKSHIVFKKICQYIQTPNIISFTFLTHFPPCEGNNSPCSLLFFFGQLRGARALFEMFQTIVQLVL